MAASGQTVSLFCAEAGGVLVVSQRDEAEPLRVLEDRTWLCARALAADPVGRTAPEVVDACARSARAWAYWAHMGCEYGPETMREVRRVHRHARTAQRRQGV